MLDYRRCSKQFLGRKICFLTWSLVSSTPKPPQTEPFQQLRTCYWCQERERRHKYEERIWEVEHASFVLLAMSCTGGALVLTNFFKSLTAMQVKKYYSTYSTELEIDVDLRCRLSFTLLRSFITCLRSARSSFPQPGESTWVPPTLQCLRDGWSTTN